MKISLRWLNTLLRPGDVSAVVAEDVLTDAGFPIEEAVAVSGGSDVMLDVEVTSNRGDVLCHVGVAREIAAVTGRTLVAPAGFDLDDAGGGRGSEVGSADGAAVIVESADVCPLFTARVVRGVKVGPSPEWLRRGLEAVGQRSINNVVDVTNWLTFELGQPTHVFDLNKIGVRGSTGQRTLNVRRAQKGESLKLLDGRTIAMRGGEVVIADEHEGKPRLVSLAGVMGGSETEVDEGTVDVLFEAATWAPLDVRTSVRRFNTRTDSSYRFERTVDARTVDAAARRGAVLLAEVSGGKVCEEVIRVGPSAASPEPLRVVTLRPDRCRKILGIDVLTDRMVEILSAHGVGVARESGGGGGVLRCTIPAHRPDLTREIDLIEEVARTTGLSAIPIGETVTVRGGAGPGEIRERATAELTRVLAGLGFFETVTFTFTDRASASLFSPAGVKTLEVSDDRRKAEPALRPSVLPSLLGCRKGNQDAGVDAPGGVRLFELSSVFWQPSGSGHVERRVLSLVADVGGGPSATARQSAMRLMRGVIESVATALGGSAVGVDGSNRLEFVPAEGNEGESGVPDGFDVASSGVVKLGGQRVGVLGLVSKKALDRFDLRTGAVAAELSLDALLALYPPKGSASALVSFPGIERDVSLVLGEGVRWSAVQELLAGAALDKFESMAFVGVYRGKPLDDGKKSVTVRLRFRDPSRTLRHEEVDPQMDRAVSLCREKLGAELRAV